MISEQIRGNLLLWVPEINFWFSELIQLPRKKKRKKKKAEDNVQIKDYSNPIWR